VAGKLSLCIGLSAAALAGLAALAWQTPRDEAGSAPIDEPARLVQLPRQDYAEYQWVDPAPDAGAEHNCGNCHEEIYRQWRGDAHARSARNPRFLELYQDLLLQRPDGRAVCASCHAPTLDFADPATDDLRLAAGVAAEGVHCDFCHKVQEVSTEHVGLAHGRFGMQLLRPRDGQLFFGPLQDPARAEDAYAPVYQESRYCSACHQGTVFGIHAYGTYSEWLASPAAQEGKQCQSCHMTPDGRTTNVAPSHGGIERDSATLASHGFFPGGKEAMLRRAIRLTAELQREETQVRCTVDVVASDVGHRVPTGFIDRHLILVIEGFDQRGQLIAPLSSPLLPEAAGDLSGHPGRLFARLLTDAAGRGPIPFWQATQEPIDTRLEPERAVRTEATFSNQVHDVRIRLIYRPFWHETRIAKGWPAEEIVLFDERRFVARVSGPADTSPFRQSSSAGSSAASRR
jgi:hypothetical protein